MTTERYNAREAEPHWQRVWDERGIFRTGNAPNARPKYYVLEMFPYPSGRIHMGHVRNYAMGDVVARYKRARGFDVLHPMGWDAFGMPAENAARDNRSHPGPWTWANIKTMRGQLKSMGLSLDWSREIATCDPAYYRHQQRLFLDFLAKGLVDRKQAKVNWDPVDMTVLANEQVIDGRGWRSGAPVEQRELTQWFLRIGAFADDLLAGLDTLDRWPDKVKLMQRNWIGRSEGLKVRFALESNAFAVGEVEVYTTRPDTLFGARFLAIAADHPLALAAAEGDEKLAAFIQEIRALGTSVAGDRDGGEAGLGHRAEGHAPVRRRLAPAGLCRQFRADGLRHRRHLRLPGARPARPRFRTRLRARRGAGRVSAGHRSRDLPGRGQGVRRRGAADQLALPRRHDHYRRQGRGREASGGRDAGRPAGGRAAGELPAARLGHLTPALLGLPDPGHPLRGLRRGAGAGR